MGVNEGGYDGGMVSVMDAGRGGGEPWFAHADAERGPRVGVIAEIGVNHDGDAERAAQLIRAAAEAGADAVKFQLFRPERLLSREAGLAAYQDGQAEGVRELLEKLRLDAPQLATLRRVATDAGLLFLVTPFSPADVADLEWIGVDGVKIASPDAVNRPLLEAAAGLGRPMLISTGTCELDELQPAAGFARGDAVGGPAGGVDVAKNRGAETAASFVSGALLQCVSAYPTPDREAALGGIGVLRRRFDVAVGYSDHTAALDTGALAVAAGACLLEKHLTHDRGAVGPDHAASVEPAQLAEYVRAARRAAAMLGPVVKTCGAVEADVRRVARQSVCSTRDLPAGHVLQPADLTVKRPGSGLPPAELGRLPGRRLARAVGSDTPLRSEHLEPAT